MTRVLYIGGSGRSGSTLLERLLGQVPGVGTGGEVVHLWQRGLVEGQRCGCGEPFPDCPYWSLVGDAAFGGWKRLDGDEMVALQRAVDRTRYIPALTVPALSSRHRRDLAAYTGHLGRLYRAMAEAGGSQVVVDSSKHASSAFLLRRMGDIDLRVVHLVRDSRGVAHSWMKQVRRPELVDEFGYMPRYRPATVAAQWMLTNSLFHGLGLAGVPTLFVRYEALVASPRQELARILDFAGVGPGPGLSFVGSDGAELGPTHSVSGNPMRFRHGRVAITLDEAWRRQMRPRDRRLVSLISSPLLGPYQRRLPGRRRPRRQP